MTNKANFGAVPIYAISARHRKDVVEQGFGAEAFHPAGGQVFHGSAGGDQRAQPVQQVVQREREAGVPPVLKDYRDGGSHGRCLAMCLTWWLTEGLTVEDDQNLVFVLIDEVESLTSARKAAISGSEPSDAIRSAWVHRGLPQ
eukprot:scaffold69368_cov51-Prasinocladus_malaysianus.AAC.1